MEPKSRVQKKDPSPWCPNCDWYKGHFPQCPRCGFNEDTGKIETLTWLFLFLLIEGREEKATFEFVLEKG